MQIIIQIFLLNSKLLVNQDILEIKFDCNKLKVIDLEFSSEKKGMGTNYRIKSTLENHKLKFLLNTVPPLIN